MKSAIIVGLAALVSGCTKTDVSAIGMEEILTKPTGCEAVRDVRYECAYGGCSYQLLCEQDGSLVLYTRPTMANEWISISVREGSK